MRPITTIADVAPVLPAIEARLSEPVAATPAPDVDFEGVLHDVVAQANDASRVADRRVESLAAGTSDDIHGTMIAVKEAEIGVKLVGSIRSKLLDAFHELWRTSV